MTERDEDDAEPARDLNRPTVSINPAAPTVRARPHAAPTSATDRAVEPGAFDPPVDRFTEGRELGRGGMGRVVEAYDVALGRPVAVKHMLSDGVTDLARFEREARITARLEHPGIVPIHDVGRTQEGNPFYVMRRIDGEPLEREVARRGTFAERISLVPNVLAACDAVGFAHARGVIHRDLKPANILIGPFGETLVIDWGIARTMDEADDPDAARRQGALTHAGAVAGTPGFMAPEQARGEALDARADVYALGATLFYVLANTLAHPGSQANELIERLATDQPPEWQRLPAETPAELRAILEKAMAPRREDRYADGTALALDLRHYVTGQLVGAYEYGAWDQLKRFVKRHRAAVAISTIAVIVITIGTTISVRRIIAERDTANTARERAETLRRESDDRSDELLVQSAQQLATTDPAAAIARLRKLPPGSRRWRAAAVAAGAANARGIPFGFSRAPRGPITTSPDSKRVLVSGVRDWNVEVFDLYRRTRQVIPPPAPDLRVHGSGWLDDWHVVIATSSSAYVISLDGDVRNLPLAAPFAELRTNGTGRAWIIDKNRRAYAIDKTTTTLDQLVIEDVDSATPLTPDRAVIRRGTTLALWSRDTVTAFAEGITEHVVAFDRAVVKDAQGQVCSWTLAAPPVRGLCVHEDPSASIVAPRGAGFVTHRGTPDGNLVHVWAVGESKPRVFRKLFARPSAFGTLLDRAGSLTTLGATQAFTLEHGFGSTNFIAQTADGRFLAAVTPVDELVVWDLPTFRPSELGMGLEFQPASVLPSSTWHIEGLQRLLRRDRATGSEVAIIALPKPTLDAAAVDTTETWVALGAKPKKLGEAERGGLVWTLRHLPTGTSMVMPLGSRFDFESGHAYRVDARGAVVVLEPAVAPIATVDLAGRPPAFLFARGAWLVVGTDHGRVCRLHVPTRASQCTDLDNLTAANLATTGVTYLTIERRLHIWALDGTRTALLPDVQVNELHWTGARMVAVSVDGLAVLDGSPRSFSTPKLSRVHVLDHDRLAATTSEGSLIVIDLVAGKSFRVGDAPPNLALFGAANSIVFNAYGWHELTLAVPTDPVALRAWLDAVTNARVVGESDVVQWP